MTFLRQILDVIDSTRARWPVTVTLVVIGLGLILSERRSDRRYRR